MQEWIQWLSNYSGLSTTIVLQLLESIAVIAVIMVARAILIHLLKKHVNDSARLYRVRRVITYTAGILAMLVLGRIWFAGLQDLGVLLGLAAAGLAIALKEPLLNLAAWFYLLIRRPYVVGDRIEAMGIMGDVIDIRMFQTYLLECGQWVESDQSTGRIALIPNGHVFQQSMINYTHGFEPIWEELALTISFESNWKKAKSILTGLVNEHAGHYSATSEHQLREIAGQHLIYYGKLTPIVYTAIRENGVHLTMRYLTPPRQRRAMSQRMWEAILEAFTAEADIHFAYPTTRFYTESPQSQSALPYTQPPENKTSDS